MCVGGCAWVWVYNLCSRSVKRPACNPQTHDVSGWGFVTVTSWTGSPTLTVPHFGIFPELCRPNDEDSLLESVLASGREPNLFRC